MRGDADNAAMAALMGELAPAAGPDPVLGAGRALRYGLTDHGRRRLGDLRIVLDGAGRRTLLGYCLDWSEQRPHLGGALGAALLKRLVQLG